MQVQAQLKEHSILLYDVGEGEDQPPYAVVSSNTLTRLEDGRRVRGREYPWGTVNIENKDHCDFLTLRSLVLAHHLQVQHSTHMSNV